MRHDISWQTRCKFSLLAVCKPNHHLHQSNDADVLCLENLKPLNDNGRWIIKK